MMVYTRDYPRLPRLPKITQEKEIVCKNHDPPSSSHHYLLCLASAPASQPGSVTRGREVVDGVEGEAVVDICGRKSGRGGSTQSHLTGQSQSQTAPALSDVIRYPANTSTNL